MAQTQAAGRRRGSGAEVPHREISISAAIALAQASCRPPDRDRRKLEAGCRFAGTLRPGDTYWFPGNWFNPSYNGLARYTPCAVHPDVAHQHMHRVTVVWGPRLDTTSDIFGRDLIRYWIYDQATGNEGSVTFGAYGRVRVELDYQYWIPAPGTLDRAAEAALARNPKCECGTCRPDLAACHHPDCQCTSCQPGTWAPAPTAADPSAVSAAAVRRAGK